MQVQVQVQVQVQIDAGAGLIRGGTAAALHAEAI
jgi:hypothetical protein